MPYTVHDPQAFYAAIVTRIGTSTGKPCGLAIAPAGTNPPYPFSVVYPLVDESSEGALSDPLLVVVWAWQVTCVSNGAAGAQWMQTKTRVALNGFIPTVAAMTCSPIDLSDGSGVTRDDSLSPPLFYSTDRFTTFASV